MPDFLLTHKLDELGRLVGLVELFEPGSSMSKTRELVIYRGKWERARRKLMINLEGGAFATTHRSPHLPYKNSLYCP